MKNKILKTLGIMVGGFILGYILLCIIFPFIGIISLMFLIDLFGWKVM